MMEPAAESIDNTYTRPLRDEVTSYWDNIQDPAKRNVAWIFWRGLRLKVEILWCVNKIEPKESGKIIPS